jgi:hypothetical protein
MTFGATGSWLFADSGNLTVNNQGTGNLLLVEVLNYTNNTVWCTGLSGGGATWAPIGTKFAGTTNAFYATVFAGTVTATGAGTAVPSWSGTAPAGFEITGHEFTSTVGSWVFDTQGTLDVAGNASTWATLTPAASGELYFGSATNAISSPVGGSTPGYVYTSGANNPDGDGSVYNLSCPAGIPTAPVWGDSHWGFGVMVLMQETSGASAAPASGPALRLPNFPAPVVTSAGWRNAGHSR